MKKEVKRGIYMVLISVILFSGAMSIPAVYNSQWRGITQGGAVGLLTAAAIIFYKAWAERKAARR